MNRVGWVGLLFVFLGASWVLGAPRGVVAHREYSVHFSEQAIHLDTPLVSFGGLIYVPVREILPHLSGKMKRRVRQNDFVLSFDHFPQTITFSRYSATYLVGDVEKRFPTPPFLFETRDYLPLEEFLGIIGYRVVRKKNSFYVVRNQEGRQEIVSKPSKSRSPSNIIFHLTGNSSSVSASASKGLSVITDIKLLRMAAGYELRVNSTGPFSSSLQTKLLSPARVYWDFRGTVPAFSDRYFEVDAPEFGHFGVARHPGFTRVALSLNQQVNSQFSGQSDGGVLSISTHGKVLKAPVISKPPTPSPKKPPVRISKPVSSKALSGRVIVIDPGHGGFDPGAVTKGGDLEKTYTLDISKRLKTLLESHGATVLMARSGDQNPTLGARTRLANRNAADLVISVHINSFVESYARGTETYYYKSKDQKVAGLIHKELVKTLGLRDNGLKKSRMFILNHSTMPGVLVEPCFMTNPRELKLLKTEAFRQKISGAIFQGILNYFRR